MLFNISTLFGYFREDGYSIPICGVAGIFLGWWDYRTIMSDQRVE